jgi:hypothetical protein
MALPPDDIALIEQYCSDGSPAEFADRARLECVVKGSAVDIVEATRMDAEFGGDWLRVPAARLRHSATTNSWTLYCFDRDSRATRYDVWEPDFVQPGTVAGILAEIEADPTNIFWG